MGLTYQYLCYLSFNISNIWCKIDSPLALIQYTWWVYLDYIWSIIGGLILTKVIYRLWTPGYCLFCEINWSIYGAHRNRVFCFVLSFTTSVTNRHYRDSKTFNISVLCTGFYLNLWILSGISLLTCGLLFVWDIIFVAVETLMVDNILRRYIETGFIEPLVVDNIMRGFIVICGVDPLVVDKI